VRILVVAAALLLPMAYGSDHTFPPPQAEYTIPNADYPLQLRVFYAARHYQYHNGDLESVRQSGIANLLTDPKMGVQYKSTCGVGFHHSTPDNFYQARWKKPNAKLEILVEKQIALAPGKEPKPITCEVDVVVQPKAYTKEDLKNLGSQDDEGYS
jgi:hypothetical protein